MDVKSKWNNNNKFHHKVLWTNITLITNGQHNTFILINGNDIQFEFSNARTHPLLAENFSYKLFTLASVEPDIFIRFVEFLYFIFLLNILKLSNQISWIQHKADHNRVDKYQFYTVELYSFDDFVSIFWDSNLSLILDFVTSWDYLVCFIIYRLTFHIFDTFSIMINLITSSVPPINCKQKTDYLWNLVSMETNKNTTVFVN